MLGHPQLFSSTHFVPLAKFDLTPVRNQAVVNCDSGIGTKKLSLSLTNIQTWDSHIRTYHFFKDI